MTISGTPSRASSTACVWRSWCGAKRRLTPSCAAVLRSSAHAAAHDHWRPRVGPLSTQSSGPTGSCTRSSSHGCSSSHPKSPYRLHDVGLPCLVARAGRRGADPDRPRPGRALRGCEVLRATGSRSARVAGGRGGGRRRRSSRRRSPRPSADRPDSARPCCAAGDRRESQASSRAIEVGQLDRVAAQTLFLLELVVPPKDRPIGRHQMRPASSRRPLFLLARSTYAAGTGTTAARPKHKRLVGAGPRDGRGRHGPPGARHGLKKKFSVAACV